MDIKPNITCTVCGENEFHHKEGFYYCNECGTQTDQVRAVEIERDNEFENAKNQKTLKIQTDKSTQPELTSWECYNYILRGIVDELLDMGAKDELKVMVLQIWTAYLRHSEVAFFNRKRAELPKLGICFEKKDANILYNHAIEKKKRRRCQGSIVSSISSKREWRKQMRNFDKSQYETSMSQSSFSQSSLGDSSFDSSSSAHSNRAIRLRFTNKARKQLKKKIKSQHLKKHEQDHEQVLTCHTLRAKRIELKYSEASMELKMRQVYAIVAIALNLIEDDIQVSDLVRFIAEGHISSIKVDHFFPENIRGNCKSMLESYRFHMKRVSYTVAVIREQYTYLCKAIHIRSIKTPDIAKLVQRYITELCLPSEMFTLIERLLNLYPPKMQWEQQSIIPCYEARAMAYIVFTLKLLFGLDGRKEKQISKSAKKVNAQLATMLLDNYEEIFVWQDWVEYIEMRKVILCNQSFPMCKQFKQIPSRELYQQHLKERCQIDEKGLSKDHKKRQENMEIMFQNLVGQAKPLEKEIGTKFTPSFTPCSKYLKRIQLDPIINSTIPDFMGVDHSKRWLMPLLKPKQLETIFSLHGQKLNVVRIECTDRRNLLGIFRNPLLCTNNNQSRKVHFNTDENEWKTEVSHTKPADSIFKHEMDLYGASALEKRKRKLRKVFEVPMDTNLNLNEIRDDISYQHSIDLFADSDMEPADISLTAPRRNMEKINLFADVSDDEDYDTRNKPSLDKSSCSDMAVTTLKISNMDCWVLMGKAFEINEVQSTELKSKLPLTFFWLLEYCANTLGVDWVVLYDQLMVLETFFAHVIEPLNDFQDILVFKEEGNIKDINKIVRHFKGYW